MRSRMAGIKYLLKTLQGVELTGLFVHQGKCRLYGRLLLTTVELVSAVVVVSVACSQ